MYKTYLFIILFISTCSFTLIAEEVYSEEQYYTDLMNQYFANTKDSENTKNLARKVFPEINAIFNYSKGFKDPEFFKQSSQKLFHQSNDPIIKEFLYRFRTVKKFYDRKVTLSFFKNRKNLQEPILPVLTQLLYARTRVRNNYSTIQSTKKFGPSDTKQLGKVLLQAIKLKSPSYKDRIFIFKTIMDYYKACDDLDKTPDYTFTLLPEDSSPFNATLYEYFKINNLLAQGRTEKNDKLISRSYELAINLHAKDKDFYQIPFHIMRCIASLKGSKVRMDKWFRAAEKTGSGDADLYTDYLDLIEWRYTAPELKDAIEHCLQKSTDTIIPAYTMDKLYILKYRRKEPNFDYMLPFYENHIHSALKKYESATERGENIFYHKYTFHERHFIYAVHLKKYKHVMVLDSKYSHVLKNSKKIISAGISYNEAVAEAKLKSSNVALIFDDINKTIGTPGKLSTLANVEALLKEVQNFKADNNDPHLQTRFDSLLKRLNEVKNFLQSKPAYLSFDKGLTHWKEINAIKKIVSDNMTSIILDNYKNEFKMKMYYKTPFTLPYKFSVDIKQSSKTRFKQDSHTGILLGNIKESKQGISFWVDRAKGKFGIWVDSKKLIEGKTAIPDKSTLSIKVAADYNCTFYLNDKKVHEMKYHSNIFQYLGVGASSWHQYATKTEFISPRVESVK